MAGRAGPPGGAGAPGGAQPRQLIVTVYGLYSRAEGGWMSVAALISLLTDLGVQLTERGNVAADAQYMTTVPGVFACGDMRRGQSLVVWAIWEGRECARGVDAYLMGHTDLPASPDPF